MTFNSINWLAVVVAALSSFALGGLWYSPPLFGNAWMADSNLDRETIARGNKAKTFGFTALFALLMAVNLAMFLNDPKTTTQWGQLQAASLGYGHSVP